MTKRKKADRVEVVNKQGAIARPLRGDLEKWIEAGWTVKPQGEEND